MPAHNADPDDRLPDIILAYTEDLAATKRKYSPAFPHLWEAVASVNVGMELEIEALGLDFATVTRSDQIDWILLFRAADRERRLARENERRYAELHAWRSVPMVPSFHDKPERVARILDSGADILESAVDAVSELPPAQALRFIEPVQECFNLSKRNYLFRLGYDPLFTWWCEKPFARVDAAHQRLVDALKRRSGADDPNALVGVPVGRDAVVAGLKEHGIAYTPEELVAIGERERQWCLGELRSAAREMGHGDDWQAALEVVKDDYEEPGWQPTFVESLANEALLYVEENDLLTVPRAAQEQWRMEMMSPERQKVNPFFLGGEAIIVSFPTNTMEHAEKRMSLRGNNKHFARATVHHELIPGHHMQQYFERRFRPYRKLFRTPFWIEGWTLHWEMLLWERGFARTPQERIGMLFWRLHRAVRVVFSLGFQMGELTAQECVEMLVDGVGHERANAIAEVRRSIIGTYDPLYQLAYLIGGLQVHALYNEKVAAGWTSRRFHDAFLRENQMPIELLRALWNDEPLSLDWEPSWRFAG